MKDLDIKEINVREILFADNSDYLFDKYAKESKNNGIVHNVKPDVDKYIMLEDAGALKCVGVFNNKKTLVGFLTMIISTMYHYSELCSTIESQFVLKDYRKYGTGKKMISLAENIAKNNGVRMMFMSAPKDSRLEIVSGVFGYKPISTFMMKEINE